jgi:hypothetical protein
MTITKADQFKKYFKNVAIITLADIKGYLNSDQPGISDAGVRKEIYYLRKKDIISPVKRGVYKIGSKPVFHPDFDNQLLKINDLFIQKYPGIAYCVWSTQSLHQFMNIQPFKQIYVIETEKDILEAVFFMFKDNGINSFLKPDRNIAVNYMAESEDPLVIKAIISRSPIIRIKNMHSPSIEKILVDVFCDQDIFFYYQGNELLNIFENVSRHYQINFSRLLNYADRRKQKSEIINYLKTNIENFNNVNLGQNILVFRKKVMSIEIGRKNEETALKKPFPLSRNKLTNETVVIK